LDYIIDNAVVDGKGKKSFFVRDNRIDYIADKLERYKYMRMDISDYVMSRGHVMIDYDLVNRKNFQEFKGNQKELINKGCTTVLVAGKANYEKEIMKKVKEVRHAMINSSLDFVIGLSLPMSLIKSSTIRACKKHNVPFILLELGEEDNFLSIPWGWVRDGKR
jgi:hypothetical protein